MFARTRINICENTASRRQGKGDRPCPAVNLAELDGQILSIPYLLGKNRHHLIGASGGNGFTPVVRLGVVELMQELDRGLHRAEAAKQQMAHGFVA